MLGSARFCSQKVFSVKREWLSERPKHSPELVLVPHSHCRLRSPGISSHQSLPGKVCFKLELCLISTINLSVNMTDALQCAHRMEGVDKAICYLLCTPLNPNLSQLVVHPVEYPILKAKKVTLTTITFASQPFVYCGVLLYLCI